MAPFPNNVRPFRPPAPQWSSRLWAVLMYGGLGYITSILVASGGGAGSNGLMIFIVLGIVYAAFIQRNRVKTSHFFRFHYLQATLLFLFLFISFKLVMIAGAIGISATRLLGQPEAQSLFQDGFGWFLIGTYWFTVALGATQAIASLFGKTPRIPVVTPNVTYWA